MAYFDSSAIEIIAILFMFIAGINFALHFTAWQRSRIDHYFRDPEFLFYGFILARPSRLSPSRCCCVSRFIPSVPETIVNGIFQVVSFATTTGFATSQFHEWPIFLPYLLMYAAIIGACAGSTGGGMKVIRILLIFKTGVFARCSALFIPRAVIPIKLGRSPSTRQSCGGGVGVFRGLCNGVYVDAARAPRHGSGYRDSV